MGDRAILEVMVRTKEAELREAFADTLDRETSRAAIMVHFFEEGHRCMIGVPYHVERGVLEIGPYIKSVDMFPPKDYDKWKKQIPVANILGYQRIEL